MARDLPPLNALRMFEAAARHLNFTKAAEELFVTQGAVSRQIRLLEDNLQQALFVRDGPRVELTPAGERYRDAVREALGIIRRGTAELKRLSAAPTLTVSVLPSFATLWLVPRIVEFQSLYPDLELRVASSYEAVDFIQSPDVDVAIRLGKGDWPGVYAEHLFDTELLPVCSPRLLDGRGPLRTAADILRFPLIFSTGPYDEWDRWFAAAGLEAPKPAPGTRYSDQQALQQAAIEGQGIALARSLLVESELRSGRLVRPIDIAAPSALSYWFVCPDGRQDIDDVRHFLEWLRHEACECDDACIESGECGAANDERPPMRIVR